MKRIGAVALAAILLSVAIGSGQVPAETPTKIEVDALLKGDPDKALARLKELTKTNPLDPWPHAGLGYLLLRGGKAFDAAPVISKANKLFASPAPDVVFNDALCDVSRAGNGRRAVGTLLRYFRSQPDCLNEAFVDLLGSALWNVDNSVGRVEGPSEKAARAILEDKVATLNAAYKAAFPLDPKVRWGSRWVDPMTFTRNKDKLDTAEQAVSSDTERLKDLNNSIKQMSGSSRDYYRGEIAKVTEHLNSAMATAKAARPTWVVTSGPMWGPVMMQPAFAVIDGPKGGATIAVGMTEDQVFKILGATPTTIRDMGNGMSERLYDLPKRAVRVTFKAGVVSSFEEQIKTTDGAELKRTR